MNIAEYQKWTVQNWGRTPKRVKGIVDLSIMSLGIAGEAGEVCDMVKKHIRTAKPMDIEKFTLELGDLLHYTVRTAAHFGILAEVLASSNVEKIKARARRNKNWKLEKNT